MEIKIERFFFGGKIKRAYSVDENGNLDGPYEEHYRDGTLKKKCNYKNQKLDGICEEYDKDGNLKIRSRYKNGNLDGLYETYYEDGSLEIRARYKNGNLDGLYETYYEEGDLRSKTLYKDGKKNGPFERFARRYYFGKSFTLEKGTYKNGQLDGLYESYEIGQDKEFDTGVDYYPLLTERCVYKNGILDGPYESYEVEYPYSAYNPRHNLCCKGIYKNGVFESKQEVQAARKGLNNRLKELNQQLAPTQLRRTLKRKEVSKFRSKYPAKNAGR